MCRLVIAARSSKTFVKCVRQATGGRIVVFTFHGVPDMEHRGSRP